VGPQLRCARSSIVRRATHARRAFENNTCTLLAPGPPVRPLRYYLSRLDTHFSNIAMLRAWQQYLGSFWRRGLYGRICGGRWVGLYLCVCISHHWTTENNECSLKNTMLTSSRNAFLWFFMARWVPIFETPCKRVVQLLLPAFMLRGLMLMCLFSFLLCWLIPLLSL
jgi:hypothetical protein